MRATQFMGLCGNAYKYLKKHVKHIPAVKCDKCGHVEGGKFLYDVYKDASNLGMMDDGPKLRRYHMKDDTFVYQVVQAIPWSSGPCIYLALSETEDTTGMIPETMWPQDIIDKA